MFLVTNWHCFSGLNPESDVSLGSFLPTHADVFLKTFLTAGAPEGMILIRTRKVEISLLSGDGTSPNWLEHARGRQIDLAAFPIDIVESENEKTLCLNDIEYAAWWRPSVSSDCFIVGFPEGLLGGEQTAIWKRGSIASEPDLNLDGLPLVLVDSLTNPGLSGSPVIAKSHEIFRADVPDQTIGPWRTIVGIYSGRIGDKGLGLQLGRVWKRVVIDELFASPKRGELPSVLKFPSEL